MKTKSIKSPGSLVVRGGRYYCFWRIKGRAVCRVLRDENGAAISTEPEAQKAKARLMQIVSREREVESLRSIQHTIDDTQGEINALEDAKNPPLSLAGAWSAFLKSPDRRDCSKASLRAYEIKWQFFLDWMAANHPDKTAMRDVTREIGNRYLESINHGKLAPGTFNFTVTVLRLVFKVLKDGARITQDVWGKVKLKANISHSRRELTLEELKKVCGTAEGELRLLFVIGMFTGLRLGDAVTLRWSEIDLRRGKIVRVPNKVSRRKPNAYIKQNIHPDLALLLAQIPSNERGEFVLPGMAAKYNGPSRTGVSALIQNHFIQCGIKTQADREVGLRKIVRVGFHSLRHSFVSLCNEAGVPLSVVQSMVGHSSPAMTRIYSHTSELAAKNAILSLPSLNGDAPAATPSLQEVLKSMTAENWQEKKSLALSMLARSVN
jgi:integrase